MLTKIKKGLDIPLAGAPRQRIDQSNAVSSVALLGADTPGLKPAMAVHAGDRVKLGQLLYTDKRNPGVKFTAPGGGVVSAINRGEKRVLQSVVIELDGGEEESFPLFEQGQIRRLTADRVRQVLLDSGLWTAFRCRPFSRIPAPEAVPHSIFITAIDTNPLAPDPVPIIAENPDSFVCGMLLTAKLSGGPTYLCTAPGADVPCPAHENIVPAEFSGPHPAGLAGTHIHSLDPVGARKTVWHIGYQDVIAIGQLFLAGRVATERTVGLGGPMVKSPRLIRTRSGAYLHDLLHDEIGSGPARVVSGSVLSGHRASGNLAWLGRYHNQVSVLQEGSPREFLAWMMPGASKYSSLRAYAAHWLHKGGFPLTTSQNGSPRAMVVTGSFEKVMPLHILPTPLLKALLVRDTDSARELGCLELDEEDLALCSFVCNGKYEYGPHLRSTLDEIEAGG